MVNQMQAYITVRDLIGQVFEYCCEATTQLACDASFGFQTVDTYNWDENPDTDPRVDDRRGRWPTASQLRWTTTSATTFPLRAFTWLRQRCGQFLRPSRTMA